MPDPKPRPWLIAAWPGMGNVAVIAATYIVQQLRMTESRDLPPGHHFDVTEVEVRGGLVVPPRLPRGAFFEWKNPGPGRDLVVFLGESQPVVGSHSYAVELLEEASRLGVERIVTFASLACGLHPSEHPKVSGVATDAATLDQLRRVEVHPIEDGQIGGLNGLVLGVAAERNIAGMCLLAEIPFFAMHVPNPKAARAALSVFSVLAGIDISLEELNRQAAIVDRALIEAVEKMKQTAETEGESDSDEAPESDETVVPEAPPEPSKPTPIDRARIEQLFEQARKDPAQAIPLKEELDRLGAFKDYEGRFLDLFRRAG